jgi:hypothetical protein
MSLCNDFIKRTPYTNIIIIIIIIITIIMQYA